MHSYGEHRSYCSVCDRKRSDSEYQIVSLWEYAHHRIEAEPNRAEKGRIYQDFIEAAVELMSSEKHGGYVGEPEEMAYRLSMILPLESPRDTRRFFRRAIERQEKSGVIERIKDRVGRTVVRINRRVAAVFLLPFGAFEGATASQALASASVGVALTVGTVARTHLGYELDQETRMVYEYSLNTVYELTRGLPGRVGVTG